ncbi:tricorn protease [Streptosporangium becharense]|uniref:Tricorn protease homolog n=1 Tax=Streptosporangium becharense TaxID=1816182 RepID=A0A7W9MG56_9ACTN|nr:S41 family peptidase [Streptosporangium becharense]MBB2909941.1 tricorn protease [Streptosporangium becharense]MBB5819104.1 tricorn protease [Streptosporangium becharense]
MASGFYLRFPHISRETLTFVADDDVWVAPVDGGRAWRLSADRAPASHPRLSPDGTKVAWTGVRDGAPEVYLADLESGSAERLTYWGDARTRTRGWTPDGKVLAVSATGRPFASHTWAYELSGGLAERLPYGPVTDLSVTGEALALLTAGLSRDPAVWKRYRGGTAGRMWVRRDGGDFTRLLADLGGHLAGPMLVGGRLVFLSDHEGVGNLYSCELDGTGLRRHTDHDVFYARHATTDGTRIVYQNAGDLYLLDGLDAEARKLDVTLGSPVRGRQPYQVNAARRLHDLAVDATGRASAMEVQGTVHWVTHRDGPARQLSTGLSAGLPRTLGADRVVWVFDDGREQGLEICPAGGGEPRRIAAGRLGEVEDLAVAPDGNTIAVTARDGRLLLVDVASGEVTELARAEGQITDPAWSRDSAWLAWSHPDGVQLRRIRLARLADRSVTDVTDGRFMDISPAFAGDYLAFLSRRGFDPVYDAHSFDMSFPLGYRPYLVPLAAATPSPFAPSAEGRAVEGGSGGDDDDEQRDAALVVDLDGIAARVVQVPVPEGRYSDLRAVKGGFVWLREPLAGELGEDRDQVGGEAPRPALDRYDLVKRKWEEVVDKLDWYRVSGDGTQLVVSDKGTLSVRPATGKAGGKNGDDTTVDLSRVRVTADPRELRRLAYAQLGRRVRGDFWVEDMADVDWDGVLEEYRPLVDRVATADDFADLLWEVVGELGSSHAYVIPAPGGHPDSAPVGLLGADLSRNADGRWLVDRVLPAETSDVHARSPLAAPGAGVRPGEALLAVDGRPVPPEGPARLLVGAADKPVELTLDGGRRVVVTPLGDDRRLRYQDWVAGRRAQVRELSGGRLGYLHIPDMVAEGWAQFHRDLRREMTFEGLVVDVRGNRGGHTSELVIERLIRRVIAWDLPRGMAPITYPEDAPRGPLVAIADQNAGSDGDIVTAAFKIHKLGPVVGTRTWGGVIGIEDDHRLADGTSITVPKYSFWFEGLGWGVENYGVDPDVEVDISPDDWAADRDPQIEEAVRLVLAALQERPAATPPDRSTRPSRRRPVLPPRP